MCVCVCVCVCKIKNRKNSFMIASTANKFPEEVWREWLIREERKKILWTHEWTHYVKEDMELSNQLCEYQKEK